MKTLRIIYHMALADFLERTRQHRFFIMLGLALWLVYSVASGKLVLVIGPNYRGVVNSAWVGGLMAVIANFLLGWFGFYLVKGSINRDYETGVGQIIATTPLKRLLYTFGKWLSNFAVLVVMVLIVMFAVVGMQLLYREDPTINLWQLFSPFLLITLPYLTLVAATAVLFETIGWLRGGLGNIIYFFLYLVSLILEIELGPRTAALDFAGLSLLDASMESSARTLYPGFESGFHITWIVPGFETFPWHGVAWTANLLLSRFWLVIAAAAVAALSAVLFDRFDTSRLQRFEKETEADTPVPATAVEAPPVLNVHLTPLVNSRTRFRFDSLFIAELKLLVKGQRWWWYAIAGGLIIAQAFNETEVTRYLLVAAWIWPILVLSGLGCREIRHGTRQIVFSAPRPIAFQLPAMWLSAATIISLMGFGALVRFIIAGETLSIMGWLTGVFFIPSLALASGVLTGSSKAFEVLYVLWMYMVTQKAPLFDFMGMTPESRWYFYVLLAAVLLLLTIFACQRQSS